MSTLLSDGRLLMDTNVVVWLLLGDRAAIPSSVQGILQDERHELLVSAVSVWEIAIKRSLGKLEIDPTWASTLSRLAFTALPMTAEHATKVEHLPWHHRDPFDRMLVAQAQVERCDLVSSDPLFGDYGVGTIWD